MASNKKQSAVAVFTCAFSNVKIAQKVIVNVLKSESRLAYSIQAITLTIQTTDSNKEHGKER